MSYSRLVQVRDWPLFLHAKDLDILSTSAQKGRTIDLSIGSWKKFDS